MKVGIFYFTINLLIMILQLVFGDHFVSLFLMPTEMYDDTQKAGRVMGLYGNLPALSMSALCLFILFDQNISLFKKKHSSKIKLIFSLTIIISTSKIALISLGIYYSLKYRKKLITARIFPIIILSIVFIIYLLYEPRFINKLDQLEYIISLRENLNSAQLGHVDWRFYCYLLAISIVSQNPFGLGLGTWGDFSSTLNNQITHTYFQVYMSDSAYAHIFVEQGIFSFLYFLIILYPTIVARKKDTYIWPIIALVSFISTMGFSDTSWPAIFAICYGFTIFKKRDNNFDDISNNSRI
ncbi:O-antigen ligase family protein [Providencia sp. PROV272]|uniref:O-antigen ligase family protein n=1 Tax=Providencia sp. PROV272 TaxID=2936800 RepID=UPI003CFA4F94